MERRPSNDAEPEATAAAALPRPAESTAALPAGRPAEHDSTRGFLVNAFFSASTQQLNAFNSSAVQRFNAFSNSAAQRFNAFNNSAAQQLNAFSSSAVQQLNAFSRMWHGRATWMRRRQGTVEVEELNNVANVGRDKYNLPLHPPHFHLSRIERF